MNHKDPIISKICFTILILALFMQAIILKRQKRPIHVTKQEISGSRFYYCGDTIDGYHLDIGIYQNGETIEFILSQGLQYEAFKRPLKIWCRPVEKVEPQNRSKAFRIDYGHKVQAAYETYQTEKVQRGDTP